MLQRTGTLALATMALAACQPAARGTDPNLARVLDRQAIEQLLAGDYPHALDTRDFDAYAALFTDDGELSLQGNTSKGRAAIKQFVSALPAEPRVIHPITNLSYEIDGDTATGGAYWQDVGLVNGLPGVLIAGRYEDTLRKVDGAWHIAKRSIVIEFAPPGTPTQ
ncbi:MAG TPA: nuclear transport factor 2 family protein [Gammaproteobacteria bacterium]|nr:nuclear transport factor 2 family protein [Gammaproteobacteria bacterium]